MSARISQKPREAILEAFRDVLLTNGFRRVPVVEVVRRAGVARSTFYEHFDNVNDLLRETLRVPFAVLAATARGEDTAGRLDIVLTHFFERRAEALALLDGGAGSMVRNALADTIGGSRITAYAIAGAQLATLGGWLEGRLPLSAHSVARILERISMSDGATGDRRSPHRHGNVAVRRPSNR
ncbi:MAG: TetR family transcriptional regulator [Candidatus Eremiobacteraeota bacterium]|nr:TetR family transcriptional regulator [Candidatus Eremiobacteraeota bacterium]